MWGRCARRATGRSEDVGAHRRTEGPTQQQASFRAWGSNAAPLRCTRLARGDGLLLSELRNDVAETRVGFGVDLGSLG